MRRVLIGKFILYKMEMLDLYPDQTQNVFYHYILEIWGLDGQQLLKSKVFMKSSQLKSFQMIIYNHSIL